MPDDVIRTTFVLPAETVKKLREFIPSRKQSKFVAEAIEQHLMQKIFQKGRELSFGAWKDENYPHLSAHDDIQRYISELRDESNWRYPAKKED